MTTTTSVTLWDRLARTFDDAQLIDLLLVAGWCQRHQLRRPKSPASHLSPAPLASPTSPPDQPLAHLRWCR
jgi:hypothetical protein